MKTNNAKKWLSIGFLLVLIFPPISFAIALAFGFNHPIQTTYPKRLSATAFPAAAMIFIATSLLTILISIFSAIKFSTSVPVDRLREFKSAVMLKNGSPGRRYSWGGAVALFIAILVCIGLLLYGPVDLAIASGSGIDISQSPAAFLVTQMLLTILAYGCIAGLSIWITTYIKLRKDIK